MFLALSPLLLLPAARRRCFHQVFGSTLFQPPNILLHSLSNIPCRKLLSFCRSDSEPCIMWEPHSIERMSSSPGFVRRSSWRPIGSPSPIFNRRQSERRLVHHQSGLLIPIHLAHNIIWYIATSIFILSNIRQERQELSTRESRLAEAKVL